jgi:hypothetical protein
VPCGSKASLRCRQNEFNKDRCVGNLYAQDGPSLLESDPFVFVFEMALVEEGKYTSIRRASTLAILGLGSHVCDATTASV